MGVKNIEAITHKLIEHGLPPATPAALIRWGTRPEQRTIVAPLQEIAQTARDSNIHPPAIMVVGKTVMLRDTLKWYEDKPLFGHRILITREYTLDYEPLEELGAEVFEFPTVRIIPPESFDEADRAIGQLHTYNWLVITSANAFKYFMERLLQKGLDVRDLKGMKVCAIGSKTAAAIARLGLTVDLVPDEFSAEGLTDAFIARSGTTGDMTGLSLLLPRAAGSRELFPERVRQLGGRIDTPIIYRSVRPDKHGKRLQRFMSEGRISLATFTSGATFNNFFDMLGKERSVFLKDVTIAVIGPVTKSAVEKKGLKVAIMPTKATIPAMVEEIIKWATQHR
jgi:uroporphyrinogen III methyltransferase/synthase